MAIRQPTIKEINIASFEKGQYTFLVESVIEPNRGFGKLIIRASDGLLVATGADSEPRPVQELGHVRQPDGSRVVRDSVMVTFADAQPVAGTITLSNPLQETWTVTIVGTPSADGVSQPIPQPTPVNSSPVAPPILPVFNPMSEGEPMKETSREGATVIDPPNLGKPNGYPQKTNPLRWVLLLGGVFAVAVGVWLLMRKNGATAVEQPPHAVVEIDTATINTLLGNYTFRLKRNANDSLVFEGMATLERHNDGVYWLIGKSPDKDLQLEYQCRQASKDELIVMGQFSFADSPTHRVSVVKNFHLFREVSGDWMSVATTEYPGLRLTGSR